MSETVLAILGAITALIATLVTSLRKREDDTVAELRRKLERAEAERRDAEAERDAEHARADRAEESLYGKNRVIHALRVALSENNIPDPTIDASGHTLH